MNIEQLFYFATQWLRLHLDEWIRLGYHQIKCILDIPLLFYFFLLTHSTVLNRATHTHTDIYIHRTHKTKSTLFSIWKQKQRSEKSKFPFCVNGQNIYMQDMNIPSSKCLQVNNSIQIPFLFLLAFLYLPFLDDRWGSVFFLFL